MPYTIKCLRDIKIYRQVSSCASMKSVFKLRQNNHCVSSVIKVYVFSNKGVSSVIKLCGVCNKLCVFCKKGVFGL